MEKINKVTKKSYSLRKVIKVHNTISEVIAKLLLFVGGNKSHSISGERLSCLK